LRQLRDPYDDFAGFGALQFLTGNLLDGVRIGLQRFHFLTQLNVFGIQPVNIFAHPLDLILRATHGNKTVRAKDIVHHQRQYEQT
jgi:hypothetical protein